MQITKHDHRSATVFVLEGRVDSEGAGVLDAALQEALAAGQYRIVLDMAGVSYINSAGLRTLADVLTRSRASSGDLRLVALSPRVQRIFAIIGFDRFFDSYDSVEAALAGW